MEATKQAKIPEALGSSPALGASPALGNATAAALSSLSPEAAGDRRTNKAMDNLLHMMLAAGGTAAAARGLTGLASMLTTPSFTSRTDTPRRSVIELPYLPKKQVPVTRKSKLTYVPKAASNITQQQEKKAYGPYGRRGGYGVGGPATPQVMPGGGMVQPHVLRGNRLGRNIDPAANMRALNAGPPLSKEPTLVGNSMTGIGMGSSPFQKNIDRNLAMAQKAKQQGYARTNTNPLGQAAAGTSPVAFSREDYARNPTTIGNDPALFGRQGRLTTQLPGLMAQQRQMVTPGTGRLSPAQQQQHNQFRSQAQRVNDPMSQAEMAQARQRGQSPLRSSPLLGGPGVPGTGMFGTPPRRLGPPGGVMSQRPSGPAPMSGLLTPAGSMPVGARTPLPKSLPDIPANPFAGGVGTPRLSPQNIPTNPFGPQVGLTMPPRGINPPGRRNPLSFEPFAKLSRETPGGSTITPEVFGQLLEQLSPEERQMVLDADSTGRLPLEHRRRPGSGESIGEGIGALGGTFAGAMGGGFAGLGMAPGGGTGLPAALSLVGGLGGNLAGRGAGRWLGHKFDDLRGHMPPEMTVRPSKAACAVLKQAEDDPPGWAKGISRALGLTEGGVFANNRLVNPHSALTMSDMHWPWALGPPAIAGSIYAGWKLPDMAFKHLKKKDEEEEVEDVKQRYEDAIKERVLAKAGSAEPTLDSLYETMVKEADMTAWPLNLLAAIYGTTALGTGMMAYNRTSAGSSKKVMEEAIKRRQREIFSQTPRPYVVKPVPIKPDAIEDVVDDGDEDTRKDVTPKLQATVR